MLIKDTSLLFIIGTTPVSKELTKFARDFMTSTQNATPLMVVAVVYVIITLPLTFLVGGWRRRPAGAMMTEPTPDPTRGLCTSRLAISRCCAASTSRWRPAR